MIFEDLIAWQESRILVKMIYDLARKKDLEMDFRLINQVAKEIWICEHSKVTPWKGNIMEYKKSLRQKMHLE